MFAKFGDGQTKWPLAVVLGLAGSLVVTIIVLAFLWPTKTQSAHNLPVSIAGPTESVATLEQVLETASPDTFDFVAADDRDDALSQVEDRDTYGAIVLSDDPTAAPEVLKATAASPVAAQMLTAIATQLTTQLQEQVQAAGGDPSTVSVTVTEVTELADGDPTGAALAAATLPLAMGGMIGGALVAFGVKGTGRKIVALATYGVGAGLILAAVLGPWFEFLPGAYGMNAIAIGTAVVSTASLLVGLHSLLGGPGFGLGAVITMFIGNPIAGAAQPWQFLPTPWGAIGQHMVPGASNYLIKSVNYFPDAATWPQWLTLACWIAAGVILLVLGRYAGNGKKLKLAQLEAAAASAE
ncbi:MAG: hypothetical protein QM607_12655 [Microbacterium sp.]